MTLVALIVAIISAAAAVAAVVSVDGIGYPAGQLRRRSTGARHACRRLDGSATGEASQPRIV
jgi:hypothetical protein